MGSNPIQCRRVISGKCRSQYRILPELSTNFLRMFVEPFTCDLHLPCNHPHYILRKRYKSKLSTHPPTHPPSPRLSSKTVIWTCCPAVSAKKEFLPIVFTKVNLNACFRMCLYCLCTSMCMCDVFVFVFACMYVHACIYMCVCVCVLCIMC